MTRIIALVLLAVAALVTVDFATSRRAGFREFDGATMGRLDADMWRSYYERRPVRLFWQLAASHREQFNTGVLRSFKVAYLAARAAFTFKDGRSREEYARALPDLERYFTTLNSIAAEPFDPRQAARDELEWWIIRREPAQHATADWERYVAAVASNIYHRPPEVVAEYARLRVEAMVVRDQRGEEITEADWAGIRSTLVAGWRALAAAVR